MTYIECLEENNLHTIPDRPAVKDNHTENNCSAQPLTEGTKNTEFHFSSQEYNQVEATETSENIDPDFSYTDFLERDIDFNSSNSHFQNENADSSLPYNAINDSPEVGPYHYLDIDEQDEDTPRPAFPSRNYAANHGVQDFSGSVPDDYSFEASPSAQHQTLHRAPTSSSIQTHKQTSRPLQGQKRPPAISVPLKRKREHPSQLKPADWLEPLSPARPWLVDSIDHSSTNPSSDVRAYCPYPAPPEILAASKVMVDKNMDNYLEKQDNGTAPQNNRVPWTIYEDDLIIKEMLKIRTDPTVPQTEKRFDVCIERIDWAAHSLFPRSHQAIKNMWCRVGRSRSGYDERKGFNQKAEHARNGWKGKPGNTKADKEARKNKRMRLE